MSDPMGGVTVGYSYRLLLLLSLAKNKKLTYLSPAANRANPRDRTFFQSLALPLSHYVIMMAQL
jgi:hypothetical protein